MKKNNGISAEELSGFCAQVAMLLEAGLPLYEGVRSMAETGAQTPCAAQYEQLSNALDETGSLYEAMRRDSAWPRYLVEMTGIGERSGRLEEVMKGLSRQYAREARVREAITSAIAYPMMLGIMLAAVILVVLLLVVPVFRQVLAGMGMGLDASATRLIGIGTTVGWGVLGIASLLLIAAVVIAVLMKTKYREKTIAFLTDLIPMVRKVNRKLSVSRELSVLSMTLSGGFAAEEAIEMAGSVLEDKHAAESLNAIAAKLRDGAAFAETMAEGGQLEDLHARMLRTAAAVGHETDMLEQIAGIYEEDAENGLHALVSVIEPVLVITLSVVIGGVLLSVMMPMAGLLAGLL
ncbi:MAG: type II secretion system F family protein [Clostridia bacterium]|nr:type II secretion system F family protein [Clostridia bacterium]